MEGGKTYENEKPTVRKVLSRKQEISKRKKFKQRSIDIKKILKL